jgi:creatinine amidohydrolase
VAILPVAAIEQHGPHLPLSTDLEIGMGLLASAFRHLPEDFPAWVLPPQAVGSSEEHRRFPGTISLSADLLSEVIQAYGLALAACGVRRLVISNSHGGNRHVLDAAGLRLRRELAMLVVKTTYFELARPDDLALPDPEWRHGLHGGAVETAMMLHLRPGLVRAGEIRPMRSLGEDLERSLRRVGPTGGASFSWLAGDLNPAGVMGDARLADPGMGGRLVEHYGAALAEVIRDARSCWNG